MYIPLARMNLYTGEVEILEKVHGDIIIHDGSLYWGYTDEPHGTPKYYKMDLETKEIIELK